MLFSPNYSDLWEIPPLSLSPFVSHDILLLYPYFPPHIPSNLQKYSTDDYPDKWWHVRKCEVVDVVETTHPPDWLTEEIIFYWRPVNYTFNWMQLGWFVGFGE